MTVVRSGGWELASTATFPVNTVVSSLTLPRMGAEDGCEIPDNCAFNRVGIPTIAMVNNLCDNICSPFRKRRIFRWDSADSWTSAGYVIWKGRIYYIGSGSFCRPP